MNNDFLKKEILAYLIDCADEQIANRYLENVSILLSGSTGWGIKEGFDTHADWDLHIILDKPTYQEYLLHYGSNHVIADSVHSPNVFAQIRSIDWLTTKLADVSTSVLYLWIYRNGLWIEDNLNITTKIHEVMYEFEQSLLSVAKDHFIKFSVRRLDASSSVKRGLLIAAGIYRGKMVEAALRTYCVVRRSPYPYSKWLAKQVELLGGASLLNICQDCLLASDSESMISYFKQLKDAMERIMLEEFGNQRWIKYWWEFNEN